MRTIDIHAHLTPQRFQHAVLNGKDWHGMTPAEGELFNPRNAWTPRQRIADMDSLGMDVQVVSTNVAFYNYDLDADVATAIARECNDEIAEMTNEYPDRLSGLANVPMQDMNAAIAEMERAVTELRLKGVMINDHVNGVTFDDPRFYPFWKAAAELNAFILIHQSRPTLVTPRLNRYHLPNSIGNLVDRTVTFATFVYGGVIDRFPDLTVCLCHGGGYTCFGIGRMDRGWQVRPEARVKVAKPPSEYLRSFYYDCLTHSEPALRYLISTVGADRVVLGTDWPADMMLDWPVAWVLRMESLSQEEKELILWKNLAGLLGI
jgi:aminocarboxymuconate-semialdehyde decarboxylase